MWDVRDVVIVSEVCVILHNAIVRMYQTGAFASDTMEETEQFDIIAKFVERKNNRLRGRGAEYVAA